MDFVSQYVLARSGTEVPIRFTRWAAIALLSMASGRKVFDNLGDHFQISPWLYYGFIGDSGSGKSTAMEQAQDTLVAAIPNFPIGAAIASREELTRLMASDVCQQTYIDHNGETVQWTPLAVFAHELTNFLSFKAEPMVEFLTAIFDRKSYDSMTIKRGTEKIINPFLPMIACTTEENMTRLLRQHVFSGGMMRRFLMIPEDQEQAPITFPQKSLAAKEAEAWCIEHLKKVNTLAGCFQWPKDVAEFFIDWDLKKEVPKDPILIGYYQKKSILVRKVAMCIALADADPKLVFTIDHLQKTIALLTVNEQNMSRLTAAVGRNELMVPQTKLLRDLEKMGGMMPESHFHKRAMLDMKEYEYKGMLDALQKTHQILAHYHTVNDYREMFLFTKERYQEMLLNGEIKLS